MSEENHTPLPWYGSCFQVYGPDRLRVAHSGLGARLSKEAEANAALIVSSVNAIPALVKALEEISEFPYVGEKSAQQMALIAGTALAAYRSAGNER